MISLEQRVAELLTDLKTKEFYLEDVIRELESKEHKDEFDQWYIGLREGQRATFQFVIRVLEGRDY